MQLQYSTEIVSAARRFDYWKDIVCKHLIPGDSWSLEERSFDGSLEVRQVGPVSIGVLSSPRHRWRREMQHVRQDPDDDLWLGYMAHGSGRFDQDNRSARVENDSLVIYDASKPFDFILDPRQMFCVRLPRRFITRRVPRIERLSATLIDAGRPGVQALKSMVKEAAATTFQDHDSEARYGSALLDILAIALTPGDDCRAAPGERDLYCRIQSYIRAHFSGSELSLVELAKAHHVSERTVTRVFALHGETPMKAVRTTRLAESHRMLAEGNAGSVTAAALDCGFSDLSHFSRLFRSHYGYTPQSLLNRQR
jgi:AraC-like DNA-binding protein